MNFYDLLECIQLKTILTALEPDSESLWRAKCRDYSQKFHTPLHLVFDLDPEFVLLNLYEEDNTTKKINSNLDDVLDRLYRIQDPTYAPMLDEEVEELVDAVLMREMKRKGEIKPDKSEKSVLAKPTLEKIAPITSGGLKFDDLNKLEADEMGKGSFTE